MGRNKKDPSVSQGGDYTGVYRYKKAKKFSEAREMLVHLHTLRACHTSVKPSGDTNKHVTGFDIKQEEETRKANQATEQDILQIAESQVQGPQRLRGINEISNPPK